MAWCASTPDGTGGWREPSSASRLPAELANELSLAIEARLKLKDLANVIHVYPTFGIVLQQLGAEAAFSEAVEGLGGRVLRTFVR